jgi:cytochrome c oxidase subunit 5a
MSSTSLLRIAARAQPTAFFRANGLRSLTPRTSNAIYAVPALLATSSSVNSFSTSSIRRSDKEEGGHHEESFEEFTARYATLNSLRAALSAFLQSSRQPVDTVKANGGCKI